MNKDIERLKKVYNSKKIPDELEGKIINIFNKNKEVKTKKNRNIYLLRTLQGTCCIFALSIILLNTNESFAKTIENIPLIGNVARVFTIREYKEDNNSYELDVKVPNVSDIDNKDLQEKINDLIENDIKKLLDETEKYEDETIEINEKYDGQYVSKLHTIIDYKVTCNTEDILSFTLTKEEGINTSMQAIYTYNYNLNTGKEITLKEYLGDDYKNIIDKQIFEKIEKDNASETGTYFTKDDEEFVGKDGYFSGIKDNTKFYIDENKNIVIVYDKYEIAPGYMGIVKFEINK